MGRYLCGNSPKFYRCKRQIIVESTTCLFLRIYSFIAVVIFAEFLTHMCDVFGDVEQYGSFRTVQKCKHQPDRKTVIGPIA